MPKAKEKNIRGADISAPLTHIELGGKEYPLKMDLAAMRVAEDVYEIQYRRNDNFADILRGLAAGKLGAIMAILYGGLLSGLAAKGEGSAPNDEPLTWEEFADQFRLTSIPAIRELLMEKVKEALPEADSDTGNPPEAGET